MRLAVFSDIHGNLPALKAILDDIKNTEEVDEIISLGDVVSIGPKPVECLRLVKDAGITAVIGNHEVECLTRKHKKRLLDYSVFFDWQCSILSTEDYKYMETNEAVVIRNGVRFQHFIIDGAINGKYPDFCHVSDINKDAEGFIGLIKQYPEKNTFIGHEHHAVTKIYDDKNVFCIGSSGCVGGDTTFYKLLDISEDGKILSIKNKTIKYNRDELIQYFDERDYPHKEFFAKEFFNVLV